MIAIPAMNQHIEDAERWQAARGEPFPPHDMLSPMGFVAPNVAIWWLYLNRSSIAHTAFLISNPDVPRAVRDIGLDAVIDRVVLEAKRAGCRMIATPVNLERVKARLERHGFSTAPGPYWLMGCPLVEGGA